MMTMMIVLGIVLGIMSCISGFWVLSRWGVAIGLRIGERAFAANQRLATWRHCLSLARRAVYPSGRISSQDTLRLRRLCRRDARRARVLEALSEAVLRTAYWAYDARKEIAAVGLLGPAARSRPRR